MNLSQFKVNLPTVGAPAVHDWRLTVSFSCSCGKGKPMLITSADQAAECDGCHQIYRVMQLHFDARKQGTAGVEIARIPREQTMSTSRVR